MTTGCLCFYYMDSVNLFLNSKLQASGYFVLLMSLFNQYQNFQGILNNRHMMQLDMI